MKYVLYGITGLYALLSLLAAGVQMKSAEKKDAPLTMLLGGVLLLAAIAVGWLGWNFDWLAAAVGGLLIMLAAWTNGKRSGQLHYSHHAIRLVLTALLIAGFVIW